jgi:hypothetical protein
MNVLIVGCADGGDENISNPDSTPLEWNLQLYGPSILLPPGKMSREREKSTYSQTSRLENPEKLQLHHNRENSCFLLCCCSLHNAKYIIVT